VVQRIELANWYVSCHPESRFVNSLMAPWPARDRRYSLLNNEFTIRRLDGLTVKRILGSADEICDVLEGSLGISLPKTPELHDALQKLVGHGAAS
jgi:N-hydroxyarylamine O-acetyltransferase